MYTMLFDVHITNPKCLTLIPPMKIVLKMSAFESAAYIQMHFRLLLIMEANTKNPDQTAPFGAV